MTHAMSLGASHTSAGLLSGLRAHLASRHQRTSEQARIRRELESYTDRQLNDLGLSRFDIEDVARGRFSR